MNTAILERLPTLSPQARKILEASREQADAPIRAELFGIQRFEEHGCSLAKAQLVEPDAKSRLRASFFPRVEENLIALRKAYDYIALTSLSGHYATPAAECEARVVADAEGEQEPVLHGEPVRQEHERHGARPSACAGELREGVEAV